jgi:hypothetical protein
MSLASVSMIAESSMRNSAAPSTGMYGVTVW